jgi:F-type H+-transporting ATPase subunit a
VFGLEFPPINAILRWKDLFPSFNKVALIAVAAALIGIVIFMLAANKDGRRAPRGVRNLAEIIVEFIEDQVVMPTMGRAGLRWTPLLISLFVFIYLCNAPGIIPVIYMPATARIAIPMCLSLLVWVIFIGVGLRHQGLGYFGHLLWPPGVPTALKPLVGVIEFVSTILIRPFSLTVRLMANMMAGHILLVTFSLLSEAMFEAETNRIAFIPLGILPFGMLMFLTAFEILVAFLQAYIFTILTGVFIGSSMEGHGDDHALDQGEPGAHAEDLTGTHAGAHAAAAAAH